MLFAVIFEDHADRIGVRQQFLQDHIDWLAGHNEQILVGGSLREAEQSDAVGGLWIVEARDRAEIDALVATDPFFIHGLRKGWSVRHWVKAFPQRKVPV